ncbi:MAG: sialate O-acetylesterase [Bacteroidota bacterium]
MRNQKSICLFALLFVAFCAKANISLPGIFGDHMVLQQDTVVTIWGWGKPNEVVKITGSWEPEKTYTIKVNSSSCWSLDVETPKAGGPFQLSITGYNSILLDDVLIGEVWLGSGQSNMEWTPGAGIENGEVEISLATYPEIRFFNVPTSTASAPQQLITGEWVVCTPETMKNFSAVLYFFGRDLHQKLGVPVGLINSSWGGTPIEIWMPESRVSGDRWLDQFAGMLKPVPWGPVVPGVAYNAMIHPLVPFRIKGALWYQGEANVDHPEQYTRALKALVDSWRDAWGIDFSFYYVQIAPFAGYGPDNVRGAMLRDQQRMAMKLIDKSGMVVISDIGNLRDIHPKNKIDVGKRLSAWSFTHDYGVTGMPFSGPLFSSCVWEPGKITVYFDCAEDGLSSGGDPLKEFQVMDEAGSWLDAEAVIEGHTVVVESPVANPHGLRYAYHNDSNPNLFNGAGFPASCFEIQRKPINQKP